MRRRREQALFPFFAGDLGTESGSLTSRARRPLRPGRTKDPQKNNAPARRRDQTAGGADDVGVSVPVLAAGSSRTRPDEPPVQCHPDTNKARQAEELKAAAPCGRARAF